MQNKNISKNIKSDKEELKKKHGQLIEKGLC